GPQPGLLGEVAAMHGRYYGEHWNFPVAFECKVAREMAEFFARYDATRDLLLGLTNAGRFSASISLDGSDPTLASGEAHLRWFVVDEALQGKGVGRRLIGDAVAFARLAGFRSIYLTTFRGLDAAASLYRNAGFRVVDERSGVSWGRPVMEQRMELLL
ncbi:unnamed protein product, partial [Phaeothamnion confervicola]